MYLSSYCSTAEYHRCWYFWLVLQYKMLHFLLCFSFFMIVLTNPMTRLKPNNECVPFELPSANSQPVVAYAAVQLTSSSSKNYYRRGEEKKVPDWCFGVRYSPITVNTGREARSSSNPLSSEPHLSARCGDKARVQRKKGLFGNNWKHRLP